jgi:hypothetical protein
VTLGELCPLADFVPPFEVGMRVSDFFRGESLSLEAIACLAQFVEAYSPVSRLGSAFEISRAMTAALLYRLQSEYEQFHESREWLC